MTIHEGWKDSEFEKARDHFISFVERHSLPSRSGLIGDIQRGDYALNLTGQLIPVNRASFHKYDLRPEDEPEQQFGWEIALSQDESQRFGIDFSGESFHTVDPELGLAEGLDPGAVEQIISYLEEVERQGNLQSLIY